MANKSSGPGQDLSTEEAARTIMDSLLSRLTERQLSKMQNPNVSRVFSRRQIQDAFLETFELVGGVSRLALWANDPKNYGDFVRLLMQLAPKETPAAKSEGSGRVIYHSAIPSSPLNRSAPKTDGDVHDV